MTWPYDDKEYSGSSPSPLQMKSARELWPENCPRGLYGARVNLNEEQVDLNIFKSWSRLGRSCLLEVLYELTLGIKGIFGTGIHAELTRSSAAESYCHKEESRLGEPFCLGAKPIQRNSKTDWESVWAAAKSGDLLAIPANVRVVSYRTLRAIGSDFSVALPIDRRVEVFWGVTGSGKSHRAWTEAGEGAYGKDPRSKFWDGYQAQQHVVIDEFRGGVDVAHLLRW